MKLSASATVRAVVVVTTDKCYENQEWVWGYREKEPMGGYDPYSNSKGCAELVTDAYRHSFFNPSDFGKKHKVAVASARAGNVIGGRYAKDRLIPDIIRAMQRNEQVLIRSPHAIRPWQHVLEPLSGYLTLAEHLFEQGINFAEGWNFGPHEASYLKLDIGKAKARLGWTPVWDLATTLKQIVDWNVDVSLSCLERTQQQIKSFQENK